MRVEAEKMEPRRRPHPPGGPTGSAVGGPRAAPGAAAASGTIGNNLAPPPQQPPPPPGYASYAGSSGNTRSVNNITSTNNGGTLPQAGDGPPDLVRENAESQYQEHYYHYHNQQQQQPESPSKYSYGSQEDEAEESELSSSFEMDRMMRGQGREGVRGSYLNKGGGGKQQQQSSLTAAATAAGSGVVMNPLSSPAASRRTRGAASAAVGPTPKASGSDRNGGRSGVYGNSGIGVGGGAAGLALTTPVVVRKPNADGSVGGGVAFAAPPQTAPRGGTATNKLPMYTPAGVALARNPHLNLNVTPNTAAAATSASGVAVAAAASSGGGADTSTGDGTGRTRDAFSPATVQLARTLDNLMDDDDDDDADADDSNDTDVGGTVRPANGATIEPSPQRAVGAGNATRGRGAAGGGGSALDALAAAIHASPRRTAMLGDNSTIAAAADLSLSSSSADPSPIRTVRGIGAAVGTGLEDWSSVYPYYQQQHHQQNQSPQGRAHYGADADGPQISFGAFSPPAKNQQPDQQSLQQDQSSSSKGVGGGSGQQDHQRSRSSDSPDAEMTQLQQQFNQLGQPSAAPPQQYPGPHRGWIGGQSPNFFGQSTVPPGAGIFGGAGASLMQDPRQAGMSPMNIPPLPSGIMVS